MVPLVISLAKCHVQIDWGKGKAGPTVHYQSQHSMYDRIFGSSTAFTKILALSHLIKRSRLSPQMLSCPTGDVTLFLLLVIVEHVYLLSLKVCLYSTI